jgi:hypothetical protein
MENRALAPLRRRPPTFGLSRGRRVTAIGRRAVSRLAWGPGYSVTVPLTRCKTGASRNPSLYAVVSYIEEPVHEAAISTKHIPCALYEERGNSVKVTGEVT